jgi:hypothetical protein
VNATKRTDPHVAVRRSRSRYGCIAQLDPGLKRIPKTSRVNWGLLIQTKGFSTYVDNTTTKTTSKTTNINIATILPQQIRTFETSSFEIKFDKDCEVHETFN